MSTDKKPLSITLSAKPRGLWLARIIVRLPKRLVRPAARLLCGFIGVDITAGGHTTRFRMRYPK